MGFILGIAAPAWGSSGHVALVRHDDADPIIAEAIHRVRGELVADGFDVSEVDSPNEPAAPELPPSEAPNGAIATIDLSVDRGTHIAELRVVDHLSNKIVIRHARVDDSNTPHTAQILAVRTVELLRASLLELLLEADRPVPGSPASVQFRDASQWAAQGLPIVPESDWGIDVGVGVLADVGGIPPAALGLARVRRTLVGPLRARITVAGLGTQSRVEAPAGSASVTQDVGVFEIVVTPWATAIVHPVASLGAGTLYAAVDGQPNAPNVGRQSGRWAAAFDAGVGAETRLGRRFSLSVEAHALIVQPYPVVEILGERVATGGQPSVLASLSLVGWL